jgi:outer membrane protein assembly factor BamB
LLFFSGSGFGGALYALSQESGSIVWSFPVHSGDASSPSLAPEALFVSSACEQASAVDPRNGCQLWSHFGPCLGGGGGTAVLVGERLWVRGPEFAEKMTNALLDRRTGTQLRSFDATRLPAFDSAAGYFVVGSALSRRDLATDAPGWAFMAGDGGDLLDPLVVPGDVYVATSEGMLYAVDSSSGTAVWSDRVDSFLDQSIDVVASGSVRFGLAADRDHLIVPTLKHLIAYH